MSNRSCAKRHPRHIPARPFGDTRIVYPGGAKQRSIKGGAYIDATVLPIFSQARSRLKRDEHARGDDSQREVVIPTYAAGPVRESEGSCQ